jgi:hypothetical protein
MSMTSLKTHVTRIKTAARLQSHFTAHFLVFGSNLQSQNHTTHKTVVGTTTTPGLVSERKVFQINSVHNITFHILGSGLFYSPTTI